MSVELSSRISRFLDFSRPGNKTLDHFSVFYFSAEICEPYSKSLSNTNRKSQYHFVIFYSQTNFLPAKPATSDATTNTARHLVKRQYGERKEIIDALEEACTPRYKCDGADGPKNDKTRQGLGEDVGDEGIFDDFTLAFTDTINEGIINVRERYSR